eukprot:5709733-Amphidinium_carterae.1
MYTHVFCFPLLDGGRLACTCSTAPCEEYFRDPAPDKFHKGWLITGELAEKFEPPVLKALSTLLLSTGLLLISRPSARHTLV